MAGVDLTLELVSHGGTKAGFHIPDDVVEALGGGRRPKVVATVGEHTWRSSIASMGGQELPRLGLVGPNPRDTPMGSGVSRGFRRSAGETRTNPSPMVSTP